MNYEVNVMGYSDDEMKDFYYTSVMMNTKVDFRVIRELSDSGLINSHRDLYRLSEKPSGALKGLGLSEQSVKKIFGWLESAGKVEKACEEYMRIAEDNAISVISAESPDYPVNFRMQSGMPRVIYCRGRTELLRHCSLCGSVAIVGSRNAGSYALYATADFSGKLSAKGITVISGMALGIDRKAHEAALQGCGSTIAILAGGPDNIYPSENSGLYKLISDKGLILSEMPPGQKPLRQYFPSRNRLIAGLSDCTLVMEAGAVSGTLHTASFAASQGKEVFVLPNNIYCENAEGGLKLLEDGCNILYSAESVIDAVSQAIICRKLEYPELNLSDGREDIVKQAREARKNEISMIRLKADRDPDEVTEEEWKALIENELSVKPLDIDSLCHALGIPFYRLSEMLITLQLAGRVVLENGKYSLTFF